MLILQGDRPIQMANFTFEGSTGHLVFLAGADNLGGATTTSSNKILEHCKFINIEMKSEDMKLLYKLRFLNFKEKKII